MPDRENEKAIMPETMQSETAADGRYKALFQQMNQNVVPSAELEEATRQRMAQTRPQMWMPRLQKAVTIAACTMLVFVSAVNLSPAFASAAARVPIVRELVLAVAMDSSMKAAIEHNYVQLVKQSASDNEYQMDVEYLVADPRNLTVYYKMDEITERNGANHDAFQFDFDLLDMEGNNLEGYGASWDYPISEEEKAALNEVQFHFTGDATLPEQVQLCLIVKQALPFSEEIQQQIEAGRNQYGSAQSIAHFEEPRPEYEQVARIVVPLTIDHGSLFNVRTLELNQTVELEGQKLIFDKVEIYPTQVRVLWHEDEANTQYIDGLKISLQSKEYGRWKGISNGVSGVGTFGKPQQTWLESSWFSDETEYQLAIEQYALIPKEQQTVTYDYAANTFTNLPDYAYLVEAVPCDTGLFLQFEFRSTDEMVNGSVLQHESVTQSGSGNGRVFRQNADGTYGRPEEEPGTYWFYNQFIVSGYEDGPITFQLTWAPPKTLEEAIIVPLDVEAYLK